jgi:hypothetical protein
MSAVSRRERIVTLLLFLVTATSLAYFPMTKYDVLDPATGGRTGDVAQYSRMYRGVPLDSIPKPYRYRILTPIAARVVPFLPASVTQFYEIDEGKVLKFRFAVVNLLSLALAALTLHALARSFGFTPWEGLICGLLFLTSFHVVTFGFVPLVDPMGYLFMILGVWAISRRRLMALLFVCLVGMFAKETTVLLVLYALLYPDMPSRRLSFALACLPGVAAYLVFRIVISPTNVGFGYSVAFAVKSFLGALVPSKLWIFVAFDGGMAFGVLWILAAIGWLAIRRDRSNPLVAWALIVPFAVLVPFLIGSNIGRIWFLAFPVILLLALHGLRQLYGQPMPAQTAAHS